MDKFFGALAFGIFGLWVTYVGVMVRLGKLRHLFLGGGFPVLAPLGVFLIAIPIGLGFIIIGLEIFFPGINLTIFGSALFLLTVILGFWMPEWIQPTWLRWLNENYGHVLGEMFKEARQMGVKKWKIETRTQEGLERWADSVAQKHGWQRLSEKR